MRRSGERATTPPASVLYSLPLEPSPRSRPFPKSAGSASLPSAPPTLARSKSWESDDKRGRSSGPKKLFGLTKLDVSEGSPFDDPLRSPSTTSTSTRGDQRASIVSTSFPQTPDCNYARRNSTISTSSMSQSPTSPMGMYVPSTSRQRYSIASSYANTIGDLSTSSMPLLRQPTRGDGDTSSNHGTDTNSVAGGGGSGNGGWVNRYQASSSSRIHLADSSRASYYSDDASSVNSYTYPPKLRQRTGSTWTNSENGGEASRSSWMREFEATGATGQVQRRGSADSRNDPWPPFVSNSYVHQPIARPVPAYLSALSTYSFPPPPVEPSLPTKISPPRTARSAPISRGGALGGASNPLAPLRKRLARSLAGSGEHLHTEVQLLLELVDALDHCITLFSAPDNNTSESPSAFSPVSRPDPSASPSTIVVPLDEANESPPPGSGGTCPQGPSRNTQSRTALLDEVRLLVRELVELVPDAQRCLSNGQYGPLAFPNTTTQRLVQSLTLLENQKSLQRQQQRQEPGLPPFQPTLRGTTTRMPGVGANSPSGNVSDWWPSRLVRDCRNLLVEAGLPTGKESTVWLAARLSEEGMNSSETRNRGGGGGGGGGGREGETPEVVITGASFGTAAPTNARRGGRREQQGGEDEGGTGEHGEDGGDGDDDDDDDEVELRAALSNLRPNPAKDESARRDELLEQGKKRWEAYRKKQMQRLHG